MFKKDLKSAGIPVLTAKGKLDYYMKSDCDAHRVMGTVGISF